MWAEHERAHIWDTVAQPWDVIVVGGGITGAGILREATRAGLRALLVEQRDFAWGTSSRSTKLAHGGFRYLISGQWRVTRDAVRERERLLAEGQGLITPLGFLVALYSSEGSRRRPYQALLLVYDLLAGQRRLRYYDPAGFQLLAPHLTLAHLTGGLGYLEARSDDARVVLRVLQEAIARGATALNYVTATKLLSENGAVVGVELQDGLNGATATARARVVVNATGIWTDRLRAQIGAAPRMRPSRGSHLVFAAWRLPVAQVISFAHPLDRRPVFILPWEGTTLVGTTDHDHRQSLDEEPRISPDEVAYLMAAVDAKLPSLGLSLDDVVASFSGVRPMIDSGADDPATVSRDYAIWEEQGLVTVTGGKWTIFRLMAQDAMEVMRRQLPDIAIPDPSASIFDPPPQNLDGALTAAARERLLGRYGAAAPALVAAAQPGELQPIPGTTVLWAELRWAARKEAVLHLDDLLLRRVRLGLMLPEGGAALMQAIRAICQAELGWDDTRWAVEEHAYHALWRQHYSLPDRDTIPDWRMMPAQAGGESHPANATRGKWALGILAGLALGAGGLLIRQRRAREQTR
jgi:glycerol-3-phosphate dehydrogenase